MSRSISLIIRVLRLSLTLTMALTMIFFEQTALGSDLPTKKRTANLAFYPCRECHTDGSNGARVSNSKPHEKIRLQHAPELKCNDCHESANWGKLSMLTGTYIEYDQAPELCGQCHGIVKRDWDQGVHGKTVGGWQKQRQRFSCAECHDPHIPKFPQMKALPHPMLPKLGIPKEATGETK